MPIHSEALRAQILDDEIVVRTCLHKEELDAMLREGIVIDTGRRCSQGYYEDLAIVKVIFAEQKPVEWSRPSAQRLDGTMSPSRRAEKDLCVDGKHTNNEKVVNKGKWQPCKEEPQMGTQFPAAAPVAKALSGPAAALVAEVGGEAGDNQVRNEKTAGKDNAAGLLVKSPTLFTRSFNSSNAGSRPAAFASRSHFH